MTERDPVERDIEREEAEAAREAANIGGRSGMEDVPDPERPLAESGQGESEGFEQAEELLEERATHRDEEGGPFRDRPEKEEEPSRAEYADADDVESTETDVDTQGTPGDLDRSAERGVPDTET
ncbi:MAG TPA: hypothetical protein VKA89_13010 [Solirubrobacterales bacterium]|nr:hypothetical protein [Solirubrobacterales bacterium]